MNNKRKYPILRGPCRQRRPALGPLTRGATEHLHGYDPLTKMRPQHRIAHCDHDSPFKDHTATRSRRSERRTSAITGPAPTSMRISRIALPTTSINHQRRHLTRETQSWHQMIFIHRFSRSLSCTMIVTDDPPLNGENFVQNIEWTERPQYSPRRVRCSWSLASANLARHASRSKANRAGFIREARSRWRGAKTSIGDRHSRPGFAARAVS
jgi:hypothetical protein